MKVKHTDIGFSNILNRFRAFLLRLSAYNQNSRFGVVLVCILKVKRLERHS